MLHKIQNNDAPRLAVIVSMLSGLESFVKRELELLADKGYTLNLYATKHTPSKGFEPRSDIPFKTPSLPAAACGLFSGLIQKPRLLIRLFKEAVRLKGTTEFLLALSWVRHVLENNTQIIHCAFGDRKYFVGYFLHRLTNIPLTVAIHAHEIYAQPNEPLFRQALKFTAGIVTISEINRRLLVEKYGLTANQIDMIRLSIDLDFWQPSSEVINVLTVARYTPRKGWLELIEAAKLLDSRFRFCAAGFGELDIEAMADAAGLADRFTVFPKLQPQHLRLLMQASDIFCLPSKPTVDEGSEGIPVVLMEAMAMGMPIVTTDDGSIRELVTEEIVPAADAKALAAGLQRMAQRLNKSMRLSDSANRQRVTEFHSASNTDLLDSFFRRQVSPK